MKRTHAFLISLSALAASSLTLAPAPAAALGFGATSCDANNGQGTYFAYQSTQYGSMAVASTSDSNGACGTVRARVQYRVPSSGATYWSSWASSGSFAQATANSVTALGGQHSASGYGIWGTTTVYT